MHLQSALVQAAMCASRTKGGCLKEKFWRLAAKRGQKRAAMAVAHKILVASYQILACNVDYADLGPTYLDRLAPQVTKANLVKRLERLGYRVTLSPLEPAAAHA